MLLKLSELADITMGQSPKSKFYNHNGNGLPFLQGCTTFGCFNPTIDTWTTAYNKIAKKGDILFTVRAPVGRLNLANTDVAIGRGLASIKPKNINANYLYYLLYANSNKFSKNSTGTIFDSINKAQLQNVKLNVHNSSMQLYIVNTI